MVIFRHPGGRELAARPVQLVHQQRPRSAQRDVASVEDQDPRAAQRRRSGEALSALDEDLAARSAAARGRVERLNEGRSAAVAVSPAGTLGRSARPVILVRRCRETAPRSPSRPSPPPCRRNTCRASRSSSMRVARIARREVREQQPADAGVARDLRRFARRRVSRLHRALGLLVAERRFVNQQIGIARRVDRRRARPRVAGDHHRAARRASRPTSTDGSITRPSSSVTGRPRWIWPHSGPSGMPSSRARSGLKRPFRSSSTQRVAERRRAAVVDGKGDDRVARCARSAAPAVELQ